MFIDESETKKNFPTEEFATLDKPTSEYVFMGTYIPNIDMG